MTSWAFREEFQVKKCRSSSQLSHDSQQGLKIIQAPKKESDVIKKYSDIIQHISELELKEIQSLFSNDTIQ